MSQGILKETVFFLHTIGAGAFLMFLYDILRIIRRLMKHEKYWVAFEDIVYWCVCGVLMFILIFRENNGIIRGFAIGGIIGGMILYHETVSSYFVQGASFLLGKILQFILKIFKIILNPFRKMAKKIYKLLEKLKNKLKNLFKRGKI
ncbi:spore cortex biosynthesis protein YabQ [Anaerosacchariphilus polymeriproducens]|uniref:Spore cortex biosynthesis protein YabQ n=1 Tax=Anaerosacchariphilus polymeriproducens TaxID=1812858 RepID=A0A371AY31_9FIRM|nr:spore cortex biosynthesis protein YabQ [Anaerosacchariphilus polymeriproducens]RDU24488.1 spore cortex biosynthesis protein YabQ [Anaerosacchariphilus polymeriproducens]